MPVVPHELIPAVSDDVVVWRYMRLVTFLSILSTGALFFTRQDKLGDPFEGSLFKDSTLREVELLPDGGSKEVHTRHMSDLHPRERAFLGSFAKRTATCTFVSCWYEYENDSEAMWRIYASLSDGIAIQSTVGAVKAALASSPRNIYIGRVSYVDHTKEPGSAIENGLVHALFKTNWFGYEKEVRLITAEYIERVEDGIPVRIGPAPLIQQVVVAPQAKKWFADVVRSVSAKYDLNCPVNYSPIADAAYWGEDDPRPAAPC